MTKPANDASELRLISAGGFKAAMEKIVPRFEAISGRKVSVTIGTPADTRRMLSERTPFDVAVVTQICLDETAAAALAAPTRFAVAISPVGMGVREGIAVSDIGSVEAFKAAIAAVGSIALSDPKAGTDLANDILRAAASVGLRAELEAKVRYLLGPGFIISGRVAAGEADAVMTLATEIKPAKGLRYVGPLPEAMKLGMGFDAGISNAAADPAIANDFIAFLKTAEARELMQSTGLVAL